MDQRERTTTLNIAVLAALEGWQAGVWTAMPAVVVSFDHVAMTIEAQVTVSVPIYDQNNQAVYMNIPLLRDVPVVFPGGGGYTLTFPVQPGDECLVVFASRCIDAWWAQGANNANSIQPPQADWRMHDLSDGFAFVGVRSKPRSIEGGASLGGVQLRSDDGSAFIEIAGGQVNVSTGASGTFTTPTGQTVTVQNGIITNIV